MLAQNQNLLERAIWTCLNITNENDLDLGVVDEDDLELDLDLPLCTGPDIVKEGDIDRHLTLLEVFLPSIEFIDAILLIGKRSAKSENEMKTLIIYPRHHQENVYFLLLLQHHHGVKSLLLALK